MNDQPYVPPQLYLTMLEDCKRKRHALTDWENRFVNDVSQKIKIYPLTDKQVSVLNRITSKAVAAQ